MVPEDCNKLSKPSSSHNILPESSSTMAIHSSKSTIELTPGEHVTRVWLNEDNGEHQWYLGNILNVIQDNFKPFQKDTFIIFERKSMLLK